MSQLELVSKIKISPERMRKDMGDLEELADSIKRLSLLHPLVIDSEFNLIAGERRLRAVTLLGWTEVPCTQFSELSDVQKKEIELEENIKRKQLSWQEEVTAKEEVDKLKRQIYGETIQRSGGEGWNLKKTAQALGQAVGTVSQDIALSRALRDVPELAKERTKSQALRKLLALREKVLRDELARRTKVRFETKDLVLGDCILGMAGMPDSSVDLVLTDPPWGIDVKKMSFLNKHQFEGEVFEDKEGVSLDLLAEAFKQMFRVLRSDRHAYIFFAISLYTETRAALEQAGFEVDTVPLIWNKSSASHPAMGQNYANCYEPIFHARKGRRDLATPGSSNIFTIDRVPSQLKIHPTEKPVELLYYLVTQSTQAGEVVLDPFAGSAATLEASIRAKRVGKGFEKDEKMFNRACARLAALVTQGALEDVK